MTSTNDGKEVKSYQAVAQKGKTYYIEFYKSLEAGLSSECDLRGRTNHLCEAWRRIHSLCQHSTSTTHPHLLSWLQRHTAKIILQTEWQSSTSKNEHTHLTEAINDFISESQEAIRSRNGESTLWESQLLQRAEWFKTTLPSPWGHATLKKLLDTENGTLGDEEFLEWLKEERGIMVVTRLRQLAASKCNDLALSLATALMDRVRIGIEIHTDADQSDELKEKPKTVSAEPKFTEILMTQAGFTSDIWELLVDIEFVLLLKCDKRSRCIELAKRTPLRTCYQLVERLENRLENSPKEKKLWKNAKEVAILIAQVTIARCMVIGGCVGACRSALYWCARALTRLVVSARLVADTVALAAPAATARHLHTLAVAVHAQSTEIMKPFVCELYVRALTAGMNELERLKMKTEKAAEARALEQTLSSWFTSLGSLLSGSPRVQCECTLTAFSVHPSPFMYEAIKKAPDLPSLHVDIQEKREAITSEFGSWANDSRSQTNLVKTSETLNLKQKQQRSNVLSTAILTEGEALGLSPELCQDIAVLLSGPRLKTLSWSMDRETLLDNCRYYMERTHGGTRALTTELKYLNLDPKEFEHLPEEDEEEENDIFYGIEKGYEHLVEFQPEEIWENATNSQGQTESPCSSSLDSDSSLVKCKKKSKRVTVNLNEDSDPLSLMAEAKRKAKKKERPHSKERSKDSGKKKIVDDPLVIQERNEHREKDKSQGKEKKKDKHGRKKKDKFIAKTVPLSNLVGMKIAKVKETVNDYVAINSVNDNNYEDQEKFSLNSVIPEVNDDVVFDGLYSMDELKSPEINTSPDKMELLKNNEFCVVNGAVRINKLPIAANCVTNNTYSKCNVANEIPQNADNNKFYFTPPTPVASTNTGNDTVKKRLTRLIDFRRHSTTKHRLAERNGVSLLNSIDSVNTDISSGIKGAETILTNSLTNLDISNGIKRIEPSSSNNSMFASTSNGSKKPENKMFNNSIHSDISNCMKSFENKSSNNSMHTNVSNCIKKSEDNFQNNVTPKAVTIPTIPKVFISKKPIEETGQLHITNNNNNNVSSHPMKYLSQKNEQRKHASHITMCNPFVNTVTEPQLKNGCLNQNELKNIVLDIPQIHRTNEFTPEQTSKPIEESSETPKQNKFQDFLKELQKSINAGAAVNSNQCLVAQTETIRKVVKPISRVTPVIPPVKKNDIKIQQTGEHSPQERHTCQKKIDNPLNTFSRLSYMHKNRQNDSKLKQIVDTLIELEDTNELECSMPKVLDQATECDNHLKTNYMQPEMTVNNAVTFNVPYDNTQIITTKMEKFNKTTTHDIKTSPISLKNNGTTLNSQLNCTRMKNENQIRYTPSENKLLSDKVSPTSTSLSEKDQNELLLLLRQQNKLNTRPVTKKNVTTNTEGNYISINQTSCSSNHTFNKHKMDRTSTSKINKHEQVEKLPMTSSSHSCASTNQKIQKSVEINKPDNGPVISRVTTTTKSSRSFLKNSDVNHHNLKKTEVNKNGDLSHNEQNKPLKGTTSTDWESVMNAILAHKTPSRGPNALDMALNKSSFAKAFADSIRDNMIHEEKETVVTKSDLKPNKSAIKTKHSQKGRSHSANKAAKHENKRDTTTSKHAPETNVNKKKIPKIRVSTVETLNTNSNLVKSLLNTPIMPNTNASSKKSGQSGITKRFSTDVHKQFTCPLPQEDDPFISGIANSDYDLLEELMDDDLRQEIGELSSDEDHFNMSTQNELGRSNIDAEKHTNDIFNKNSNSIVITKPDVSIIQNFPESEPNRIMPVSILKCDDGAGNIYTSTIQENQTYIHDNPDLLQEVSDNMKLYNTSNIQGSHQVNNLITSNKENHSNNYLNNDNNNENIISNTTNSPNLLMSTVAPQNIENLVLIEPGVSYEHFSPSQVLQNNVNNSPANKYVGMNETADLSLYQTIPFVAPVEKNKITPNQDLLPEIPVSVIAPEIESTTQFDFTKMIKATANVTGVYNNEFCNSKSEGNFNLDDELNDIISKNGESYLNLDINKNNERKVLSQVQEKQNVLLEKNEQDYLKNSVVTIGNDFMKTTEQDRLKIKRLRIINRQIHNYSSDKPIPLTYMPLKSSVTNLPKIKIKLNVPRNKYNQNQIKYNKAQRLESLLNGKIKNMQNATKSKTSKENKFEEKQNDKSEPEKVEISIDDNNSESVKSRQILLRSSNKNHQQSTIIDTYLQCDNDKTNVVTQKVNSIDCDDNEKVPTPTHNPNKIVNESSNESKDLTDKDFLTPKKLSREKKKKKKEKLNSKFEQLSTDLTHMDPIDIEDQILGSKIPKNDTFRPTMELKSNITPDSTEVPVVNTHSLLQHPQSSNKLIDVQTRDDRLNIIDFDLTNDQRAKKAIDNVIIPPINQATQKAHTWETNEVEKNQDLIDLTSENTEPAKATFLIHPRDLNINDTQEKESFIYKHFQTKDPNVIQKTNKKNQNYNSSSEHDCSSVAVHKTNSLSVIPQSYKDSIKIIPLPSDSSDPLRKFVRIKLPNGRTFKATSYGKEDVDFDTLFSDPSLKSVLLGGLTDKTRYTLNIKQVATTTIDNPKKIIETRIQEINLEAKTPTGPIETIDLLSDDEDNNVTYQYFKTQFGDFKIRSIENVIFASHQKKFGENCQVKLISFSSKQHVPGLNVNDISCNKINNIEDNLSLPLIEEIINKNVVTTIQNGSDIIEISDKSKDIRTLMTTNVSRITTPLKAEINEQTLQITDVALSNKQNIVSDNRQSKSSTVMTSGSDNILFASLIPKYPNCYVKLVNCDDVVKKYEKFKLTKPKCFIDLIKCRDDTVNFCTEVSSTNTEMDDIGTRVKQDEVIKQNTHVLSKTDCSYLDLTVSSILEAPMHLYESCKTSPVIDAFEKIASINNDITKNVRVLIQLLPCVAEWFDSKPQLSSRCKENQITLNYNRSRLIPDSNTCVSEWYVSKPKLSYQNKVIKTYNNQSRNSFNSVNNVPKLTTIVNKYLHNNCTSYQLECLSAEESNPEFNHSKNLKRKLSTDEARDGMKKISKVASIPNVSVVDCGQDKYNSSTNAQTQSVIDSFDTESYKTFDFVTVSYDSDRESDLASNNSESILADHVDLFDNLIFNEKADLIPNDCKRGLLQTKEYYETFAKEYIIDQHETDNSCLNTGLVLQYNNIKTEPPRTCIEQSNSDNLVKKLEVDEFCNDVHKKTIAENQKSQNNFDLCKNTLKNNGSIINCKNVQSKEFVNKLDIIRAKSGENYENNKQDLGKILDTDIKKYNETSNCDLSEKQVQDNCVNNRDEKGAIIENIPSNENETSKSSNNTKVIPVIFENIEGGQKRPIAKYITESNTTSQLLNTYTEHSYKHTVDNVIKDNFHSINNKVQVTKITDNYATEELLKPNNDSQSSVMKLLAIEDPVIIEETDVENIQLKKDSCQPKINQTNLDHEYTALYVDAKHTSELEISKYVTETEEQKCVFVIDDDITLTDDKYDNLTETIVDMNSDEILHEDYFKDRLALNNKGLSIENICEADFDKKFDTVETKYLALQENDHEYYSKLDSHNKDSTIDIDNLVDSIKNHSEILKNVNISCPNKNISCVSADMKGINFNENGIEALDSAKKILQTSDDKSLNEDSEHFKVLIPKVTYVNKINNTLNEKKSNIILKRKIGMNDVKIIKKKYRKGKNIDHPKFTTFSVYTKEFTRLSNYLSSVKFSFSRPFHKENIDVPKMLTGWPINESCPKPVELESNINDVLFEDLENIGLSKAIDPLEQTLAEELSSKYDENECTVCDINETNFNMGFGEGSGRVIQNLEGEEDSTFSAATLSDVKQIQPFLLSEDYDDRVQDQNIITIPSDPKKDDQLDKIRHYLSYIQLKDKVQAFFRKTSKEFSSITERNLKSTKDEDFYDTTTFPFGLTHPDFIEPGPVEAIVHVVQVGQLPVTAAAQNPVTCDPRVTQVSDASPPQCSENSLNDDLQTPIKTEYTELTTADLSLPVLQEYATHNQDIESQVSSDIPVSNENIPIETEIKSVVKIELMEELSEEKIEQNENPGNCESSESNKEMLQNVDYTFDTNSMNASEAEPNLKNIYNSEEKDYSIVEEFVQRKQQQVPSEKIDQIAHAMNAAGISTTEIVSNTDSDTDADHTLINMLPDSMQTSVNNYTKAYPNTMSLQQALAQILPPVLNQNGDNNQGNNTSVTPQILHIVQGKNTPGSQITLVDNSQQSVINGPNSTSVLHFVQNKGKPASSNPNGNIQSNPFNGLSLVDTGVQQGGNQLLQIVNTGPQKTNNAGQLLKQVNFLTNLSNVQGSNEQKMVQFLCKSADGKAIQLNGPHPRSMVLRIQPVESPSMQANSNKPHDTQDLSPTSNIGNHIPNKEITSQQEIKSRSVYEENYAKFIQNSSAKQVVPEKSTSLPKFNQVFGKQGYQDGEQKQNDINETNSHLASLNINNENADCPSSENTLKLDHIGQMTSPPLLLRKSPAQTTQPQSNFVQQVKQTISPINLQPMHGSVIYRQIPVNLSGGQTINLITVPNTEIADDPNQKQQPDVKFMTQNEMEQSIIKIVPQNQPAPNVEVQQQQQEENNPHININNENTPTSQQPVLTQMRIKLPMLSKTPQMVSGARVVRPSFFQIQRNVIGANQQVYQQLVLTAAPPLGHQTAIRLPQTQNVRQIKVPNDNPSSAESQMSSSTLEQLREFDLVLEQVKERSTVQPNGNTAGPFSQLHPTSDTTDGEIVTNTVSSEQTHQVVYSIGNNQQINMSYVSRKPTIPTPTTSTYVRSPDSSGIVDSPPSSSHTQIPHTVTSDSTINEAPVHHKPTKSNKPKPRPKASSNPPNTLKLNPVPPKTSTQKPLEDEQTTQRILYILAEYKEQVENSPDKDKPAPRRRTNFPPSSGSSKRKKSSSSSRRHGRDMSPIHGDDTCRTMGSEDSSCGTSQGECTDCLENHSPQESPRKVVRKLSFEQESPINLQRQIPQRNVIVADGQTITVARGTTGKPTTAVLMPANYILPVSMVKGGQQIAIVTNRGPKLLTVTSGEGGTTNALLLQRLITPAGLKPVLTRPGVRHVRLPAAALHSLQAFNLAPVTNIHPPDSTVPPVPAPTPPELVDTRANTSPWTERDSQEARPDRGSSPEGSGPWNLPTPADPNDYSYEETVRTENMNRTVLDPIPDRYSPDMEAQRIFDKMFDVDSKKSYMINSQAGSPRCGYDLDTSDCDDKAYHQIVHKKEGTHRQHRLTHVSAAALRHKYAVLEHELRLQKSLSEECEDLGVDSPSASELFPEAELLFSASPAPENTQDHAQHSHVHTPQPTHNCISQPDIDDQIATDQLLPRENLNEQQDLQRDLQLGLEDVGIVTVSEDGLQTTIALDHEEFARSHPNTTFHSEPTDESEMQPFTITGIKGRHITSTIFHAHRPSGTVLMSTPQTTVISQAIGEGSSVPNTVKYSDIENMIDALPSVNENSLPSVLVKDDGLARFNNILTDTRELHISNTASAIIHSTGNATQVIRRVCCEGNKRDAPYFVGQSHGVIAGDDAKIMPEDSSREGTMESSMHARAEEDRSTPEHHTELFWESNSASERSDNRRPLDFSSDSDKCCKSPYDETNSTDSGGVRHLRLDSVIKEARGFDRGHGADCSSADDMHPPLRTYPPKRLYHSVDGELDRSLSGKTGVGHRSPDLAEVRRRASGRGVVKRGCHCCTGSPAPPRPKKSRPKKLIADFATN